MFLTFRLPVMLGLAAGSLVVAMVTVVVTCYFCRCCWLYRRRKRLRHGKLCTRSDDVNTS